MLKRLVIVAFVGLMAAACVTTYDSQENAILSVIGGGLTDTYVWKPPVNSYLRGDGAECQVYRIRQFNRAGQARDGEATVCRLQGQSWLLTDRAFGPWSHASYPPTQQPAPPSTSYPVQNPSYPVQQPNYPQQPQPQPQPTAPGSWVPVTR